MIPCLKKERKRERGICVNHRVGIHNEIPQLIQNSRIEDNIRYRHIGVYLSTFEGRGLKKLHFCSKRVLLGSGGCVRKTYTQAKSCSRIPSPFRIFDKCGNNFTYFPSSNIKHFPRRVHSLFVRNLKTFFAQFLIKNFSFFSS